jgi:hypothetical protein
MADSADSAVNHLPVLAGAFVMPGNGDGLVGRGYPSIDGMPVLIEGYRRLRGQSARPNRADGRSHALIAGGLNTGGEMLCKLEDLTSLRPFMSLRSEGRRDAVGL